MKCRKEPAGARRARRTTATQPKRPPRERYERSIATISDRLLAGFGKTLWARRNFTDPHVWGDRRTLRRMLKKSRLLTRPTLAVISPARPESAGTASSPRDAPSPKQGRSE